MDSLQNKVAVVTGAGSGMGEAIVRLLAARGVKVVVADLKGEAVDRVVADLAAAGGEALGVEADVSKNEDLERLVSGAVKQFGTIDILVNNAGILDNFMTVGDLDLAVWDRVMNVNVKGPAILSQLAI
ncbi:MAG: SDR family NAD(P)-dependent oxidoreductase, partial [Rikenellaceae bacterium]|nr:SDR family NAD(P)-dependent oxidoreductase [Rikenellaceae bacterium]